LLWLLYFWCWLPFIYIVSFLIDQAPKAYAALITYSAVVPIVALILKFIMGVYLPKIQPVYHTMCLLLLPPYAMSYGFWIIIGYEISPLLMNVLTAAGDGMDHASIYSWDQLGRILTLMAVSGVVYWAVLMAIQTRRIARFFHALWRIPYRSSSVSDEVVTLFG
uniref:Nitrate_red_gam domain-containing protein n=1 Tax=Anisakis simplex TaxID=6269 RepID=A0A0M3JGF8_ANISI